MFLRWHERMTRFWYLSRSRTWSWGGGWFRCDLWFVLRFSQSLPQPLPGSVLRFFRVSRFTKAAGDTALSIPGLGTHDAAKGVDVT